ncbi:MAG: twin-arginine translocase TatA/TatE family subunit [Lachnospiraceae bacterium]|nr:twin-arginine translocase TatA/TatE family subunit [Lachnospiraceae bacterium]
MRGGIGEFLVILLVIAVILLITGGKKIPELAKSLKKGKDILTEDKQDEPDKEEDTADVKSKA